jgi:hypothetical protein
MNPRALLFSKVCFALAALGLLSAGAAWIAESRMAGQAVQAQRVRPSDESALFGDIGETIGSPTMYVVTDKKAFLDHKGPGGLALIDETYLEKTGTYPLQLQTVRYVANLVKLVGVVEAVVMLGLGVFLRRKALAG